MPIRIRKKEKMKLRNLVNNKRAQLSPLEMVAAVIIVVFILVIILYAVNSAFRSYVNNIFSVSGKANIDTVKQNCENSCNIYGKDSEDYKNSSRDLVFADGFKVSLTCKQLESPISACKSGTWLVGISKEACEGTGQFTKNICYDKASNVLVGTSGTYTDAADCIAKNDKSKALTFSTEICVNNGKVIPGLTSSDCVSGKGKWEVYRAEPVNSVCTVSRN